MDKWFGEFRFKNATDFLILPPAKKMCFRFIPQLCASSSDIDIVDRDDTEKRFFLFGNHLPLLPRR